MPEKFNLIMVSASFEAGGNVFHRHLDGHPSLFNYGFEFQTGTALSTNALEHFLPLRYRYPIFEEGTSPESAYIQMWDEEQKCYLRTPNRSKFVDCGQTMNENKRKAAFIEYCKDKPHTRKTFIEALLVSTFQTWENYKFSGKESHYVGYNPGMVCEIDKLFSDFPDAHVIHIIRNPWSSFSDYLKRPYPEGMTKYLWTWNIIHHYAKVYSEKYKGRFHIIRTEDFFADKRGVLEPVLNKVGLGWHDNCGFPSFNGKDLSESVYPWGTLIKATTEQNLKTARELSLEQIDAVSKECSLMIDTFGYRDFLNKT